MAVPQQYLDQLDSDPEVQQMMAVARAPAAARHHEAYIAPLATCAQSVDGVEAMIQQWRRRPAATI